LNVGKFEGWNVLWLVEGSGMDRDQDKITIQINGSEANRQLIVDEICRFLCELSERLSVDLNGRPATKDQSATKDRPATKDQSWGFDLQSTRPPKLK
jgi:hypothetical protein